MATMREIAELAGVSLKTVSRVHNDDPHVRPEVRARVKQLLLENAYVPNELAQTFRSGKGRVIGVAVPDLLDPFYAAVTAAISEQAERSGYATLVTATGFAAHDERQRVEALLARRLAGLVFAPVTADQSWLSAPIPTVLVDQPAAGVNLDAFTHEDRTGASLAVAHLVSHGFHRVGFLGRAPHLHSMRERLAGYRQALDDEHLRSDDDLVVPNVDGVESATAGYAHLLRRGADAVFAADPRTTVACLPVMRRHPIALVGFGDFPLADLLTPSVSVIDQSPSELGSRAVSRLLGHIDRDSGADRGGPAVTVRLPVRLVERQSCQIPALG
jgi:LacI family transcriptional regulator